MQRRAAGLLIAAWSIALLFQESASAQSREEVTVQSAQLVLSQMMGNRDSNIPQSMLVDAYGLVIVPDVVKGSFVVGVRHGRGVVLVRDEQGVWQAPTFLALTGGSVGWQIGVQATDVVLVFKTQKSVQGLLSGKFTIGADAAAAAGPVGRQAAAATDGRLSAEIYSYSRSRGLFAGVSLDGSVLQIDPTATQSYYQSAAATGGLQPGTQLPVSAARLVEQVAQLTRPATASPAGPGSVAYAPAAGSPPLTASPPLAPLTAPAGGEQATEARLRQQLAAASQRLQPLLDSNWQRYLALPAEVYAGTAPPEAAALKDALSRFESVTRNTQYAALSARPEFQATLNLLNSYLSAQPAAAAGTLNLPAPPHIDRVPAAGVRY